jgi:hypothetical protein
VVLEQDEADVVLEQGRAGVWCWCVVLVLGGAGVWSWCVVLVLVLGGAGVWCCCWCWARLVCQFSRSSDVIFF